MGVCFSPGQDIGRGDLDIFLQNSSGNPANAAEISYAIYYVDQSGGPPGVEVLIGPAQRTPVNPSVGEYYAALQVPPSANPGDYRIRWTFRELPGHPLQMVVQEFGVVDPSLAMAGGGAGGVGGTGYSAAELSAIRSLRILLRDNCVGAEETVELDVDGERMLVRMDDLWESCTSPHPTPVRQAFQDGNLRVRSVSPEGEMEWKRVLDVHRADVGPESIWEAQTEAGPMVLTGGHRVFVSPTEKVEMEQLEVGQTTLGIDHEQVGAPTILGLKKIEGRQYMYDLTAEDWHNFVLHRSKVVISNSPDRNYKFRPPEQAGVVRQFNQVFGFIWEDYELIEYIIRAIAWFNMFPPSTGIRTIDQLVQQAPEWCTAVFMQAIVHATMALALNWASDEFSVISSTCVTMVLPDGTEESVAIGDLYTMVYGTEESAIRAAFQEGQLRVRTVHPETGEVADLPCTAVLKHHTPHKKMMRVELEDERSAVFTEDHSLFVPKGDGLEVMKAGDLRAGDTIITVKDGQKSTAVVAMVEETLAAETTYDLSVPGPQNFMLANGILAHNSYSIGGISMDIEKSSKYESIKSNAEGQFQMAVEAKKNTTLFIRGLCQPRYGLGIRSAFGPHTGRGTLGPRSFI